jgi:chromosome partitioning protein
MKSIAFINQKGGVGKTTCTLNIGAGLARLDKKVLLVDFDPQANLTCSVIQQPKLLKKTLYQLLQALVAQEPVNIQDFIVKVQDPYLSVLPSSLALSAFENLVGISGDNKFIFKQVLQSCEQFDYVLIDCPPSLGHLTLNVLAAVDEVYLPVQTEFYALQGLSQISDILRAVNQSLNPSLKLGGIIGTRYNRRKLHKEIMGYLRENFQDKVFKTTIRENIAVAEAPSFGKDVFSYSPESSGAEDYHMLGKEIIKLESKGI